MTNARGMVAFSMPATSAELPSMCNVLKLEGNSVSASRRSPPSRSVAGFCGLTSLVAPTAVRRAGSSGKSAADEQPATTNDGEHHRIAQSTLSHEPNPVAAQRPTGGGCTRAVVG